MNVIRTKSMTIQYKFHEIQDEGKYKQIYIEIHSSNISIKEIDDSSGVKHQKKKCNNTDTNTLSNSNFHKNQFLTKQHYLKLQIPTK